jgi:hypothetical protein
MLRKKVPFLLGIPEHIFFQLTVSEFLVPSNELMQATEELERSLQCFIMTYKSGIFDDTVPLASHLCSIIKSAKLTIEQEKIINQYEYRYAIYNVSFVAYSKPLIFIQPQESPLYKHYTYRILVSKK